METPLPVTDLAQYARFLPSFPFFSLRGVEAVSLFFVVHAVPGPSGNSRPSFLFAYPFPRRALPAAEPGFFFVVLSRNVPRGLASAVVAEFLCGARDGAAS